MRNLFTVQIESYLGAVFIILLAGFFVGLIFIAMKNFDSDLNNINATQTRVRFE